MTKELLRGELTQEEVNEKIKQNEKEMKTNIDDNINQYRSQVEGKNIFGQVPKCVWKTHKCKSLGYFIFVC